MTLNTINPEKKINDSVILRTIATHINYSIPQLATEIGMVHNSLYDITAARKKISNKVKSKLLNRFENINPEYLNTGTGEVILNKHVGIEEKIALLTKKIEELTELTDYLVTIVTKK